MDKIFKNTKGNQFKLITENQFAAASPEGEKTFGSSTGGVWNDTAKAEELKKYLMSCIDAGNFDLAHQTVDQLTSYHN
jgi:hypothetical protein